MYIAHCVCYSSTTVAVVLLKAATVVYCVPYTHTVNSSAREIQKLLPLVVKPPATEGITQIQVDVI